MVFRQGSSRFYLAGVAQIILRRCPCRLRTQLLDPENGHISRTFESVPLAYVNVARMLAGDIGNGRANAPSLSKRLSNRACFLRNWEPARSFFAGDVVRRADDRPRRPSSPNVPTTTRNTTDLAKQSTKCDCEAWHKTRLRVC